MPLQMSLRALQIGSKLNCEMRIRSQLPPLMKIRNITTQKPTSEPFASVRTDWSLEQVRDIYHQPLLELIYQAATVHRLYFNSRQVQQCTLLSIKTGGCTEDCKYCSQSSHHRTFVKPEPTKKVEDVLEMAKRAKKAGSTRFCMGSAWREVGKKNAFKHVLEMVRQVKALDMEVCCTLGMLTLDQATALKEAGLSAYNHNLDTSREHYAKIITTRSYDDRLATLQNVRKAGISVCCGGILGLGEGEHDRVALLHTLATMTQHPESVPVNALVAVPGTPLYEEDIPPVSAFDMARTIATARIVMPKTMVRLSAGRMSFTEAEQGLLFLAGANSVFTGDRLLTTSNPEFEQDQDMFTRLGLIGKPAHQPPIMVTHSSSSPQQIEQTAQA
ncbi:unnamed protein product [Albugo candida]|uniref:biotin synthase n=1 Tax=Albugo candida TaxID=65357 RepID=A0A024GIB4_9STRA|nr:unnamed protein product [Albugo candida]|eukprot:CCI46495.1 unnamed protein product [Albugo candida]